MSGETPLVSLILPVQTVRVLVHRSLGIMSAAGGELPAPGHRGVVLRPPRARGLLPRRRLGAAAYPVDSVASGTPPERWRPSGAVTAGAVSGSSRVTATWGRRQPAWRAGVADMWVPDPLSD